MIFPSTGDQDSISPVRQTQGFRRPVVQELFRRSSVFDYSVAVGNQRFVVNNIEVSTAERTLNVIVNWEKAVAVEER
jgi:hypothetical protein